MLIIKLKQFCLYFDQFFGEHSVRIQNFERLHQSKNRKSDFYKFGPQDFDQLFGQKSVKMRNFD